MSQLGQSRRFGEVCDMSALPPTTAVMMQCRERQKGANSGREQVQHTNALLDDLVSTGEHRVRHADPKRLCGSEVDGKLKSGRLYHWQVRRLDPIQNPPGVDTLLANRVVNISSVADQATSLGIVTLGIYR